MSLAAPSQAPPTSPLRGYSIGRFRIDLPTRQLLRDGEPVSISARAWDALVLLLANRSRVVSKDELISQVWPDKAVSDDVLPQTVLTIRRALGDDSAQPRFVATIPRRGYRFVAPVTEIMATSDVVVPFVPPAAAAPAIAAATPAESPQPRLITAVTIAAAVGALAIAAVVWLMPRTAPTAPIGRALRFAQSTPPGTTLVADGVLSPDGRALAFVTEDDQTSLSRLWVRSLNAEEAQVLAGTDGARRPFWAPDSRSIGFFVSDKLKQYSLDSGTTQTVATVGLSPAGAAWSGQGQILFASWKSGLQLIPATGGQPAPVTQLNTAAHEVAHRAPQFLPDGEHFLYYAVSSTPEQNGTYLGRLGENATTRLVDGAAVYAPPGYLVWTRDGALLAQSFDLSHRQMTGSVRTVAASVGAGMPVSAAGEDLLAFGGGDGAARFVWFDRRGQSLAGLTAPTPFHNPAFSNDWRQLVASSGGETEQRGVWLVNLSGGAPTRLVAHGNSPLFSPDGATIVYTSDLATGVSDIYEAAANGRDERLLLRTAENKIVNDWSPDGRYLVFVSTHPETKKDMWLLPRAGAQQPIPFLTTRFNEIQGRISPDGRWIAYASDESGQWEVYVQSFPSPGQKQIVSVGGGAQPNWRADGRELFYLAPTRSLMSVDVVTAGSLTISRPKALFRTPISGNLNMFRSHYVNDARGERFLVDVREPTPGSNAISVIVNWRAMLGQTN